MSKLSVWKLPVIVILAFWVWQFVAYRLLVPRSGLAYGWFKTPAGHAAGLWVLTVPAYAVLAGLVVDAAVGSAQIWQSGRRLRIVGLWLWCAALYVVFGIPSLLVDFQGNASIFV